MIIFLQRKKFKIVCLSYYKGREEILWLSFLS